MAIQHLDLDDLWRADLVRIWPVLVRSRFEENCERFWEDPHNATIPWYALYTIILALGCRAQKSAGSPLSFQQSEAEAWNLFEIFLSLHTELLYCKTTIYTVQVRTPSWTLN